MATYKRGRGFQLGATGKQIQLEATAVPSLLSKLEKPQDDSGLLDAGWLVHERIVTSMLEKSSGIG